MIVIGSAATSPGVTTIAMSWAAIAGEQAETFLVEADPAGGAAAAYAGLHWNPGLVSLAAGTWGSIDHAVLSAHSQELAPGARVVVGPGTGQEATAALAALGPRLAEGLVRAGSVVVDVGRVWPASPAAQLVLAAELAVVVVRQQPGSHLGTGAAVGKARALAEWLAAGGVRTAVIAVGERPYPLAELEDYLGTVVLGVIPIDPRGAGAVGQRSGRRSAIARACRGVVAKADTILSASAQAVATVAAPLNGRTDVRGVMA